MAAPLADRIRPQSLDEMVGQQHLLGPNGLLRRIAQSGTLPNLIFYGPSGVGKTTAARIIAAGAGKKLYRLNGTTASTGDIKALIADLGGFDAMGGVVLYLDEIQYLNKSSSRRCWSTLRMAPLPSLPPPPKILISMSTMPFSAAAPFLSSSRWMPPRWNAT